MEEGSVIHMKSAEWIRSKLRATFAEREEVNAKVSKGEISATEATGKLDSLDAVIDVLTEILK